jgi:Zn-dependent protease with chaperone function/type II secretory pathway pseudopilin PulG
MAQSGSLSSNASGRFWICPKCNRHVPTRLDACRCGGTKADLAPSEAAAAAALPPPDATLPGVFIPTSSPVPPPPPIAPTAYAGGRTAAVTSLDDLVYPNERSLFAIGLAISAGFWLMLLIGTMGLALGYALVGFVFYLFAQSGLIAYIRGNAVRITPQQYPDLHQKLSACCQRLGIAEVPETFLLNANGVFNAFATRFLGRNFLVLYSDIVDALESRPGALSFYLGHELGHVHRGHLAWRPVLLPASFLPLLGPGYSRACETTCDNYGAACCDNTDDAVRGLSALAAGGRRWQDLNLGEYLQQARETSSFWMSFHELVADYPWLVKRVARVVARGGGAAEVPGRNPFAYVFALFVPRSMAGAGIASMLIMVAIIGIIAAIAIPSLLRARVAANEASAIGDVRTVISAEAAYESRAGSYGTLECLAAPAQPGCIDGYAAGQASYLEAALADTSLKSGYRRSFSRGRAKPTPQSRQGFASFCYAVMPAQPGQTGTRSFAGDQSGRICAESGAVNLCSGGVLPDDCTPLS